MTVSTDRNLITLQDCAITILCSFLFCLKFSLSTSPIYGQSLLGYDQSIFMLIGKYWTQGVVPYLELWDHKGPMIYFINGIGQAICGKTGVFILQCLFVSVFLYFVFKTFRIKFSRIVSWLLSIISLFWLACSYEGGNLTEEYLLPFLAIAVYNTIRWIDHYERRPCDHKPDNAFLLGIILALGFLTRLTNALGACGAMLAIGLVLIRDKRWNNLFRNVAAFLFGFLVLTLPFATYFWTKGAFQDFIFGSLTYNVSYMNASTENFLSEYYLNNILGFSVMAVNCLGLLLVSVYMFFSNPSHRVGSTVWLFSSCFLGLWLFRSSLFSHYRTVALPFFPVLVLELFKLKRYFHPALRYMVLALLIIGPVFITTRKWTRFTDYFDRPYAVEIAEQLKKDISTDELTSLMIWGDPQMYIYLDIRPIYRNFGLPESQGKQSDALRQDIRREYMSRQAGHILVHGDSSIIQDILDLDYERIKIYEAVANYSLYKRKNGVVPM